MAGDPRATIGVIVFGLIASILVAVALVSVTLALIVWSWRYIA